MNRSLAFWARVVAVNAAAAILAQYAFGGATLHTPLWRVLLWASQSFGFSMCCSSASIVVLPLVAPKVFARVGSPFNWLLVAALLVILAAAGSLVAMSIFAMMGLVRVRDLLRLWSGEPLKISVICTLLFGMFFTVVEHFRARLDAATLALRTKQRDEAEARSLAAEAQLASIESRVQPHFLFNTLNSIAALVHDDPAGAERMTGQLAALLRSALDSTAVPLVPLDQELRVVRAYLDIERVRFGDRLRYDVNLGEGAGSATVPRMALQTLVENSVKYAVSPRREGGSICVTAARSDGRVRITVEDDGPGFNPAHRPDGHGLALLDARLAMLFGDRATMRVDSRNGHTGVTIDVPAESTTQSPIQSATRNPQSAI